MKSEEWYKSGFEITPLQIDVSNQKNQIATIKDLAPCFGLDADIAIMQMWTNYGFERGVEILCEALLLECVEEQDYSENEQFEDGYEWREHLKFLREYRFGEDYIREQEFSWDRTYLLGNNLYSFSKTDASAENEDEDEEYEILIQNTRIGIRVGRFE